NLDLFAVGEDHRLTSFTDKESIDRAPYFGDKGQVLAHILVRLDSDRDRHWRNIRIQNDCLQAAVIHNVEILRAQIQNQSVLARKHECRQAHQPNRNSDNGYLLRSKRQTQSQCIESASASHRFSPLALASRLPAARELPGSIAYC